MWASFDFLMSGLLSVGLRWRDEKGGHQGSWMEPPIFFSCLEMGRGSSTHPDSHTSPRRLACTIPHSTHLDTTISAHTTEDALEGLYLAFSTILRCLPYFLPKTRPRASYDLLEAFSSSCGRCGGHLVGWREQSTTPHTSTPPSQPTPLRMP